MKKVQVVGRGVDVTVELTWLNLCLKDYPELQLKQWDDLGIHYRNHKDEYTYTNIVVYDKPYHPKEKLDFLVAKNPTLQKFITKYDLVLSV